MFKPLSSRFIKKANQAGFNYKSSEFETLNEKNYQCPICGSTDRDRMIALRLEQIIKPTNNENLKVIQFAPSESLSNKIKQLNIINYKTADLYMDGVDDKIDITNMHQYQDNQFDILICSHVLEHVENDIQAMKEIHRVIKPNGKAFILTPILLTINHDIEHPKTSSPTERLKYFGQEDHVRLYSKQGFENKLRKCGFEVNNISASKLANGNSNRYGINLNSVLYELSKN
jgi:SAM-dependent methyltransferase